MRKLLGVVIAAMLLAPIVSACDPLGDDDDGSSATPTVIPIEDQDPSVIIEQAVARWNDTETAHFVLEIDGETYLDSGEQVELAGAEGDLARPHSVEAVASVAISLVTLDVSLIFIGDDAYMTDFMTGDWGPAPADFSYNPALLLSQTEGLGPVLESLNEPEVVGRENVAGHDTVHLRGSVTQDLIDELTAGAVEGDQIGVDIWFDVETLDVVKIDLAEPEGGTTWIISLSNHNESVTIEAPDV